MIFFVKQKMVDSKSTSKRRGMSYNFGDATREEEGEGFQNSS